MISFEEMTSPRSVGMPAADATTENPSRGQGRPTRAGSRLGQFAAYEVVLAYVSGAKTEVIAAEWGITCGYVSRLAEQFGLRRRGRGRPPGTEAGQPDRENEERLRQWARDRAAALRREAHGWELLAELE